MRILQLRSEFRDNGPGSQALSLAIELRRRGHEVIFSSSGGVLISRIEKEGFLHIPIESLAVERRSILDSMQNVASLRRLIRRHRIELVHAHNAASIMLAGVAARLSRRKVALIQSVRGLELRPKFAYRNWIYRINPAELLAVSEFTRQSLVDIGARPDKIHITYNGIDLSRFDPDRHDGENIRNELALGTTTVIGHVGNFSGWKGQDVLVYALDLLRADFPDLQLVLVGNGPEFASVADLVRSLGLESRVCMPGLRHDIPAFQAAFDLYCQPSTKGEMFPNAIIEAMAMGNSWIGSDISGLSELTADGAAGRVIPPNSADALADAIRYALQSPKDLHERGMRARAFVVDNFTIEKVVDRIERVYRKALDS